MRISHSGKQMYQTCSEKFRLHYREKLRSPKIYSSLFFGSALDEAFSRLLLDKKKVLSPEEQLQLLESADDVFYRNMCKVENNGEVVEVSKSPFADYYTSDYTPELLTVQAVQLLCEYAPDVVYGASAEEARDNAFSFMESCKAVLKSKKKLSEEDLPLYNYITWLTLVEKGYLMLEAYRTQIMPQIFEVYSIQELVTLKSGKPYMREVIDPRGLTAPYMEEVEDEITGLIDFTCSFVSEPGTLVVVDNKTSSKPYKESQLFESAQLATYCEFKETNKAAYVVVEKKLYAKAPQIRATILTGTIPEATFADTFDGFEQTVYSISTGVFEKNFKSCFEYGRMCAYFGLCKHGNAAGLIDCKPVPVIEVENESE